MPMSTGKLGAVLAISLALSGCGLESSTFTPLNENAARDTLVHWMEQLSRGDYSSVAATYGGDYGALRGWNMSVGRDDHPRLWKNGCTINGLNCLPVKQVVGTTRLSPEVVEFSVLLENKDGTTQVIGPCCGEIAPPDSVFTFQVERRGNRYFVISIPPLSP
jgi:hypothetical protein